MGDRILTAMSGGVDSSVTAALLKEAGYEVFAATLKTFCYAERESGEKACCGLEGLSAARAAAAQLEIPHVVFDVSNIFETEVIDNFVREYSEGRTPNPCVRCNATVKIPWLLEKARTLGCTAVATGHYAGTKQLSDGTFGLFRGIDTAKDQAYFLWELSSKILPFVKFPLANFTKKQVRELARRFGLPNAEKAESQEICFVAQDNYIDFLRERLPQDHPGFQPGPIVDKNGRTIGQHAGYLSYTIGQRKGLGGGHGKRLFVTAIRPETNTIVAGENSDLFSKIITLDKLNILAPKIMKTGQRLMVQIRHRAKAMPAQIVKITDDSAVLEFDEPVRSVTPGQSGVLFDDEMVVAGGRIIENKA